MNAPNQGTVAEDYQALQAAYQEPERDPDDVKIQDGPAWPDTGWRPSTLYEGEPPTFPVSVDYYETSLRQIGTYLLVGNRLPRAAAMELAERVARILNAARLRVYETRYAITEGEE